MTRLSVPWLSQLDQNANFAPGDCGPACVAMILRALGKDITVNDVSRATGQAAGFTSIHVDQLRYAASRFDASLVWSNTTSYAALESELANGHPSIALVHYPLLPRRRDPNYNAGHYVVIVGIENEKLEYLDPYWLDEAGGRVVCTKADFRKAWGAAISFKAPWQVLTLQGAGVPLLGAPTKPPVAAPPSLAEIATLVRWNIEEAVRELEMGNSERARARLTGLVQSDGAAYQVERRLKGG